MFEHLKHICDSVLWSSTLHGLLSWPSSSWIMDFSIETHQSNVHVFSLFSLTETLDVSDICVDQQHCLGFWHFHGS